MADNAPTTPAAAKGGTVSPLDLAIGLSILDALGNGGEIYARRNSSIFNNNFDAFGLPRNRFSLMQNILPRQEDSPMWGRDLRNILGANAEVYPGSSVGNDSLFGMGIMNMLFGNGIFGRAMGDYNNAFAGESNKLHWLMTGDAGPMAADMAAEAAAARQATAPGQPAPAANTPRGNAAGSTTITSASGARIEEPLQTVTVRSEDGEAPVAVAASRSRIASTSSSAEPPTVSTTRMMRADTPDSDSVKCEAPKPSVPVKACVVTRPGRPGGMG
jgi:hypothetical protein